MAKNKRITIETTVNAPLSKVWKAWTNPKDIMAWNHASDDWTCPKAENDLRAGGKFSFRMESKDGSTGFDFGGTYEEVIKEDFISYAFGDRHAEVGFEDQGNGTTHITETFDPENENPVEMQRGGWQAILDNFKKHVESKK